MTSTRSSAFAALAAGLTFLLIQVIHPAQTLEAAKGPLWAVVHTLTLAMAVSGLVALAGLWRVQQREAGWLGLVGLVFFGSFLLLTFGLVFVELSVLPTLAVLDPTWALGFLGLPEGKVSPVDLGVLPGLVSLSGVLYMIGGFAFGWATFRARVLSRVAGLVFGVGAASALLFAFLPHSVERLAAVPLSIGWILLGLSLWKHHPTNPEQILPVQPHLET